MTGDVARGDSAAARLTELYVRHAPPAQRLAYLLTGDPARAEDLVQEAFVRVVGRFAHLRVPDAFDAYLRRTIVNLHTSHLRRLRLERAYLERERTAISHASEDAGSEPGVREELWRALLDLPPRQRAAIVLRYYEDLSERETAEVLGCSRAAAKALVARGMEALRDRIRRDEP
ncbi:ECF RNA polymerase sigma factor SigE [bacterium HR12]|nr:ECF RNA polymerase sigma factor SigE [bacterium HR12]